MVDKNKTCECARAVSWDTALKFSPQPSAMTSPDRLVPMVLRCARFESSANIGSRILYKKYDLSNVKFFQKNGLFQPEMIVRPFFCVKDAKNTGLLILDSLKQKKLIFNFVVNRN